MRAGYPFGTNRNRRHQLSIFLLTRLEIYDRLYLFDELNQRGM